MFKVEAIIQPFEVEDAKEALLAVGIAGVTVTEVKGFGRHGGHKEIYRGAEYTRAFVPRAKLEMVVTDDAVEKVSAALIEVCSRDRLGDGLIFASPLDDAIRIRTAEMGDAAIVM